MLTSKGFVVRLALLATAFVVGQTTMAPGRAEAPAASVASAALAPEIVTASQTYGWRVMQWDFAWEFGESLDSAPYRGANIAGGRWVDASNGTGRAAKHGGGVEFQSGYYRNREASPDFGTTMLTLQGKPARLGRWEIKERSQVRESKWAQYRFVMELIPADPADYDCGSHNLTIGQIVPGSSGSVGIGVNAGRTSWHQTLTGYQRREMAPRTYAVQVTGKRITWFINGRAVASLGAAAAIPQVPMTVRLRLVGDGQKEMNSTDVQLDWVRNFDLTKGLRPPAGKSLVKGTYPGAC